eukprot:CAMPEP_0173158986 /NCGR_PEP_ID=MMETSP1105-20130129/16786_1 /TAXON_ID=2985 /ORGANISM="Ochromonas sp., Strain BG-1" /LENGTH=161 /DNA_ID=CAMNT_0014077225 /DNA_START=48 /DNA_END=533 /DNA_ORIENTATION=+
MPQFYLKVKADLENIKSLTPSVGNLWKLDIQTPGGGEVRNGITISSDDVYPLEGSRGEANFVIKWPYATDQSYIKILTNNRGVKPSYTSDDSGNYVTILGLECRNIEPTAWHPSFDFVIESSEGTTFDKVDLSDRDWADYDEENDLSVSITNLEYKIESSP